MLHDRSAMSEEIPETFDSNASDFVYAPPSSIAPVDTDPTPSENGELVDDIEKPSAPDIPTPETPKIPQFMSSSSEDDLDHVPVVGTSSSIPSQVPKRKRSGPSSQSDPAQTSEPSKKIKSTVPSPPSPASPTPSASSIASSTYTTADEGGSQYPETFSNPIRNVISREESTGESDLRSYEEVWILVCGTSHSIIADARLII
jgi:hypothetical protein